MISALAVYDARTGYTFIPEVAEGEPGFSEWEQAVYESFGSPYGPLNLMLRFTQSRNPEIAAGTRARVASRPYLPQDLVTLLGQYAAPDQQRALRYIVDQYQGPLAPFAPAWTELLDYHLRDAQLTLPYCQGPQRAESEAQLLLYVLGARKIQQAGGDLRPVLERWRAYLQAHPDLEELNRLVNSLL